MTHHQHMLSALHIICRRCKVQCSDRELATLNFSVVLQSYKHFFFDLHAHAFHRWVSSCAASQKDRQTRGKMRNFLCLNPANWHDHVYTSHRNDLDFVAWWVWPTRGKVNIRTRSRLLPTRKRISPVKKCKVRHESFSRVWSHQLIIF